MVFISSNSHGHTFIVMQCGQLFNVSGQMYGLGMWTYMLFHMKYEGNY
jgi:hypothetical protein